MIHLLYMDFIMFTLLNNLKFIKLLQFQSYPRLPIIENSIRPKILTRISTLLVWPPRMQWKWSDISLISSALRIFTQFMSVRHKIKYAWPYLQHYWSLQLLSNSQILSKDLSYTFISFLFKVLCAGAKPIKDRSFGYEITWL